MDLARLKLINIPADWIPGRDAFVRLRINPKQSDFSDEILPYAEIAASIFVWLAKKNNGFKPIPYQNLSEIKSPLVRITSPEGDTFEATRLAAGIKILIELGWVENDEENRLFIVDQGILKNIIFCHQVLFSSPCA